MLAIGDNEPFVKRPIAGAPAPTERTTEHLLDGQQRVTAFWKALNDGYEDRTYFAVLNPEEGELHVKSYGRWERNGRRFPLWVDQPEEQFSRGLVPIRLLNPDVVLSEIGAWCDTATGSIEESRNLERRVTALQYAMGIANLPYLELPVQTPPDEAIEVFILMNTSSVRLSAFDIVVAQLEAAMGESLHDLESSLRSAVPDAEHYVEVSDLILRVAALREGRSPTEASFRRLNLQQLPDEWDAIERGISGAVNFLNEERIFDRDRLPTVAVVPVLASIWSQMPQSLDAHGEARSLLRQYLWRSFFTDRYERGAATAALQDHRGLKARLVDRDAAAPIPVLNKVDFPIAEVEELEGAPWPRLRNTLARAILTVSLRGGGRDFADDTPASRQSLTGREYHHLFPVALLNESGMDESKINLALNCALVTWNTNRNISAKEPVAYLRERVERVELGNVDESDIRRRVNSHIIPFDELNVGGYSGIVDEEARARQITSDYLRFIRARAEAVHEVIEKLCRGEEWSAP